MQSNSYSDNINLMKKREETLKKVFIESILAGSILITSGLSNDRAEKVRDESSTKIVTEYAQLHNRVEEVNKLFIEEDGTLTNQVHTYIYKEAPEGYEIDYIKDVAYKTKQVKEENEIANKIYKYTIIRNNLLSVSGILFTSLCVYKFDEEVDKVKKMLLK